MRRYRLSLRSLDPGSKLLKITTHEGRAIVDTRSLDVPAGCREVEFLMPDDVGAARCHLERPKKTFTIATEVPHPTTRKPITACLDGAVTELAPLETEEVPR
jgi:hypothetical protein